MPVKNTIVGSESVVRIFTDDVEPSALQQLENISNHPATCGVIAAMPDVHWGMGATIGSVIPTRNAIIPSAVGVDIGCGMSAVKLSLTMDDMPDSMKQIRKSIESKIPVGFSSHRDEQLGLLDSISVSEINNLIYKHPKAFENKRKASSPMSDLLKQLGTLGGGNHFIELCSDLHKNVWIMLHSGSRGFGNRIGRYFINEAKESMSRGEIPDLKDANLAYFTEGTELMNSYYRAMTIAQYYALLNRRHMMSLVIEAITPLLREFVIKGSAIECHHNYAQKEFIGELGGEVYLTRKGAISARSNELGIIPGSMGERSFIVRGKGNSEGLFSASHGAGRIMSRNEAKKTFTVKDMQHQTDGVECRKDENVIDEIPAAYKNIDTVMRNQNDLVDIVTILKQFVCVKG